MISGYDNVIFSNKTPAIALNRFTEALKRRWTDFLDDDEWTQIINSDDSRDKEIDFFFCKNSKMDSLHEENGYHLNSDGEGCFYLIVRAVKKFAAETTIENELKNSSGDLDRETYSSIIILDNLHEYTIVTPGDPKSNEFSAFLISILTESIVES